MSACSSCQQPIIWARMRETNKPMPLNPRPIIGGNLALEDGVAWYVKPSPTVALYTSHFASCPSANSHRKGRRS